MPQRPHLPPIGFSGRLVLQQAVLLLHTGFACKRTSGRRGYEEVRSGLGRVRLGTSSAEAPERTCSIAAIVGKIDTT